MQESLVNHIHLSYFMMLRICITYFTLTSTIGQKEFAKGKAFIYENNKVLYANIYTCN
jgi:hypothetical protein